MYVIGTRRRAAAGIRHAMLALAALLVSGTGPAAAADLAAGRHTYETACATCHGATGRPDPDSPVVQALGVEPADLSDPLFNSREPAGDWEMVVKYGGHALGLSSQMPAQGEALTDEQVRDVVAYIKTLADTRGYPPGEMNLFLPIRTRKAFPEDEVVWKSRYSSQDGEDVFRNVLEVEKRVGRAGQVLLEVVHEDDGVDSKVTEVELGYKHALYWNAEKTKILSGAVVLALPTEGGASEEIIPYLAWGQLWSDEWAFQASARAIIPVDEAEAGEFELAGIVHYQWTPWPRRVFGGLELTATTPFEDDGGDRVKFTVVPQVRIGLTRGGHVALNLGVEVPLSDQPWDYRAHLNLLWDFADGSFFAGW